MSQRTVPGNVVSVTPKIQRSTISLPQAPPGYMLQKRKNSQLVRASLRLCLQGEHVQGKEHFGSLAAVVTGSRHKLSMENLVVKRNHTDGIFGREVLMRG